jgi:DNA-binding response OmpR family regulator
MRLLLVEDNEELAQLLSLRVQAPGGRVERFR